MVFVPFYVRSGVFTMPEFVERRYSPAARGELNLENPDQALPALVQQVLPVGIRGLVVSGLLAALMSSLSSVFNSTSTLITWDVYREWKPQAGERELVWVGRVATVGLTVAGFAWIPLHGLDLVDAVHPPAERAELHRPAHRRGVPVRPGVERINASGAMACLLSGFVLGAIRLVLELMNGADKQGLPEGLLKAVAEFNFLHFAVVLFVICVVILIGVSMATGEPPHDKIAGLTREWA